MPSEFERVFMRNAWGALMGGVGLWQGDISQRAFRKSKERHCQKTLPISSTNQNPRSTILISASGSLTQTQIWIAHQIKTEPQWLEIVRVAMRFELVTSVSQLSGHQTRVFEKLLYPTIQV
jgi:hypothetical protein